MFVIIVVVFLYPKSKMKQKSIQEEGGNIISSCTKCIYTHFKLWYKQKQTKKPKQQNLSTKTDRHIDCSFGFLHVSLGLWWGQGGLTKNETQTVLYFYHTIKCQLCGISVAFLCFFPSVPHTTTTQLAHTHLFLKTISSAQLVNCIGL